MTQCIMIVADQLKVLTVLTIGFTAAAPESAAQSLLQAKADFLCAQFIPDPSFDYAANFTEDFRKKVSYETLLSIFKGTSASTSTCISAELKEPISAIAANVAFHMKEGSIVSAAIAVTAAQPVLLNGFRIVGIDFPEIQISSWDDVSKVLSNLGGNSALSFQSDAQDYEIRSNEKFGLASEFKLYVLGALSAAIGRSERRWDEVFPIVEEWKSLPSGTMQNLPAGTQVSLMDFAKNMISISDNTATDHLIHILGRESVEAMLVPMGNHFVPQNTPLMTTSEMFKLKWALPQEEASRYLTLDSEAKLEMLQKEVDSTSLDKIGSNGISMDTPFHIDDLEWFASTNDVCRAMQWLRKSPDSTTLKVLSISAPLIKGSHWKYVGFKGGSEPGVLTMTYLLENQSGEWGCLSLAWNNPKKEVSELIFFDVVSKTLQFIEAIL